MKNIKGCLLHTTDNWKTPTPIYNAFMNKNFIDCFKYQSETDETKNYYFNQKLFINPPFSKMKQITKWIKDQIDNECIVALLIPSRTDTNYFHDLMEYSPTIIFIKKRLHYNDSKQVAPFPTILMLFEKQPSNYWRCKTQEQLIKYIEKCL